ncbi:NnrS family protein [Pelagimonas sp. KU-00592-HH]|uniref:NnrS family protein n=1 Tax=Pelagimonas sp. KU-00592-HH TaxID=3127651 RepID=UPI00310397E0
MFATIGRIYSEGFRVFFLSAAVYGMFTGGIWLIWLISGGGFEFAGPSMIETEWHSHEMIFGYATAAVGGFFLTAVPNWTNAPAARGAFIAVVSGAWLIGRVAIWFYAALPVWLVIAADLLFVPILAAKVLSQLLKRPKPQNMVFLFILSSLWVANGLVHLEWAGIASGTLDVGMRMGLLSLCSMIAILGGRVTPAFTRNAMKRAGVPEADWPVSRPPLEKATMILALGLPWVVTLPLDDRFVGTLAVLFGVVQILRVGLWRGAWTRAQPILWSLHLGMGFLGLGFILWGAALWGLGSEIGALHVLGIGCVGVMTVAVMSRASLGHTGRPLKAPKPVAWAYGLMAVAAALRWGGTSLPVELYMPAMMVSAALWSLSFALFFMALAPVLGAPRMGRAS